MNCFEALKELDGIEDGGRIANHLGSCSCTGGHPKGCQEISICIFPALCAIINPSPESDNFSMMAEEELKKAGLTRTR